MKFKNHKKPLFSVGKTKGIEKNSERYKNKKNKRKRDEGTEKTDRNNYNMRQVEKHSSTWKMG